jgi:hypothetical protein
MFGWLLREQSIAKQSAQLRRVKAAGLAHLWSG